MRLIKFTRSLRGDHNNEVLFYILEISRSIMYFSSLLYKCELGNHKKDYTDPERTLFSLKTPNKMLN